MDTRFWIGLGTLLAINATVMVFIVRAYRRTAPTAQKRAALVFRDVADFTLAAPWFLLAALVLAPILCWPGPLLWSAIAPVAAIAAGLGLLRVLSLAGPSVSVVHLVQMVILFICMPWLTHHLAKAATGLQAQIFFAAAIAFLGVQALAWPWVRRRRMALGNDPTEEFSPANGKSAAPRV